MCLTYEKAKTTKETLEACGSPMPQTFLARLIHKSFLKLPYSHVVWQLNHDPGAIELL